MSDLSDAQQRELLALIWAMKPSDLSALGQIVRLQDEAQQATAAGSGNDIFYRRLIELGLAREAPSPGATENARAYALTPGGKAWLARLFQPALSSGWPPRESVVTPPVLKLLEHNAGSETNAARPQSMSRLAAAHSAGKGIPQNMPEALRLYHEAAELGDPTALNNLGVFYYFGQGVPQDKGRALAFFQQAADAGSLGAADSIGNMYARGEGVDKNDAEAVKWYRKAAEGGFPQSMCNLADFYAQGRGVAKDNMQACIWYSLGIRGGLDARQPRDAAARTLTPQQVKEANDIIESWQPRRDVK